MMNIMNYYGVEQLIQFETRKETIWIKYSLLFHNFYIYACIPK